MSYAQLYVCAQTTLCMSVNMNLVGSGVKPLFNEKEFFMRKTLADLETKFWQSMVDQDTDTALSLLSEPSAATRADH